MILKSCIKIDNEETYLDICGVNDKKLRRLESLSNCKLYSTGSEIFIEGEKAETVEKVIRQLIEIAQNNGQIYSSLIDVLYQEVADDNEADINRFLSNNIEIARVKKVFNPRTINQGYYIQLLNDKDIVFSYGPAGTGKTFISIAYAINELLNKKYQKVILTRPVVEAGESLGFLPGDYIQKINPYLIPLFDAIHMIINQELYLKLTTQNLIEIAPLAYMRGRTFENAIVILDEAQNSTCNQMKMFLTRLGLNAKLIITGDITQVDLPKRTKSGMIEALELLRGIEDIGFIEFEKKDVVRHPLVKKIISAYSKNENL